MSQLPPTVHAARVRLSVVVPCYNEEPILARTIERLCAVRERLVESGRIDASSDIVLVDDGSRDATWSVIEKAVAEGLPVHGVKLSRNCGHQNALLAGLSCAKGDAVVTIDADLQDDETAIERMVAAYRDGHDVVYGVRQRRDCDAWFKRTSAHAFYRLMDWLGARTIDDHADYRLLSRRALEYLDQFDETNMFLRGIVPLIGLRSTVVRYDRRERTAGQTKYPLRRMLEFALDGITAFSVKPLRIITLMGFMVSLACLLLAGWALAARIAGAAVPGWASTILPIYLLGGIQLLALGVLGEYVGRTYSETKRRPRFFVEEVRQARPAQHPPAPRRAMHLRHRTRAAYRSLT